MHWLLWQQPHLCWLKLPINTWTLDIYLIINLSNHLKHSRRSEPPQRDSSVLQVPLLTPVLLHLHTNTALGFWQRNGANGSIMLQELT